MGFFIKNKEIAKESVSPVKVSMANNPNFIEFESEPLPPDTADDVYFEVYMEILNNAYIKTIIWNKYKNISPFTITEVATGKKFGFRGLDIGESYTGTDTTFEMAFNWGGIKPKWSEQQMGRAVADCIANRDYFKERYNTNLVLKKENPANPEEVTGIFVHIKAKVPGNDYCLDFHTDGYNDVKFFKTTDIREKAQTIFGIVGNGYHYRAGSSPSIYDNISKFTVVEKKTGIRHIFRATSNPSETSTTENLFYTGPISSSGVPQWGPGQAADTFFACLQQNTFLKDNFHLSIAIGGPILEDGRYPYKSIYLTPRGFTDDYAFTIEPDSTLWNTFVHVFGNPKDPVPQQTPQEDKRLEIVLTVTGKGLDSDKKNVTEFNLVETNSGTIHTFRGTMEPKEMNSSTFYLGAKGGDDYPSWSLQEIANSLKECLLRNSYLKSNFDISLPFQTDMSGNLGMGTAIRIVSKGFGQKYNFTIKPKDNALYSHFLDVKPISEISASTDAISQGYSEIEIQMDMYKDTGIFLGEDPTNNGVPGTFVTTLSKAYLDAPVWFDLNAVKPVKYSDTFLTAADWCDTGTVQDYRFIGKRLINDEQFYTNDVFYMSDVLYTITGYDRNLEANDLTDYIYDVMANNTIRPLTRQPELPHIAGQAQYFNFLLSDKYHHQAANGCTIGIRYELLTQSGTLITRVTAHEQSCKDLAIANTIRLDIDSLLALHSNTGIVKVCLTRDGQVVSSPQIYNILPSHLYAVRDFAFLNSLGGWSTFNFSESSQTDFKSSGKTFNRTQQPRYTTSSVMEGVQYKSAEETFTVQTMAIRHELADWLKEMSVSPAVYEVATGRYIVVDDLTIKHSTKDTQVRVDMKYHYSDTYNSEAKS
ncbi:hypothetical protein [Dysgonomonas sp. 25]|uniref:hypothetical protein n=1 Tax=Dysgonomonas sp. 25 TaxID=2302933 RepID=UPI0013D7DFFE|nr:hypothetical protein [Dysgonomonas sp. 25]NDV69253.1 hypothetical protein [Dysgonomonas sp. 25]